MANITTYEPMVSLAPIGSSSTPDKMPSKIVERNYELEALAATVDYLSMMTGIDIPIEGE